MPAHFRNMHAIRWKSHQHIFKQSFAPEIERCLRFRKKYAEAARRFGVFANLAPFEAEVAAAERRVFGSAVDDQRLHSDIISLKTRPSDCVERLLPEPAVSVEFVNDMCSCALESSTTTLDSDPFRRKAKPAPSLELASAMVCSTDARFRQVSSRSRCSKPPLASCKHEIVALYAAVRSRKVRLREWAWVGMNCIWTLRACTNTS